MTAICFNHVGRKRWDGNQISASEPEPARRRAAPTPALPGGFLAQFDCCWPDEVGASNTIRDEVAVRIETSSAEEGRKDQQLAPAARPADSNAPASASGNTSARKPRAGGASESVFGGAFSPTTVSPPDKSLLNPHTARVYASESASPGHGHCSAAAPAVVSSPTATVPAAESSPPPPEQYFIAYGHCLLAGAGTGASEAAEVANSRGRSIGGDFGGASGRARVSKKKRTRGYGDALEVFQEGLRRFPTSVVLLYGASLAMQVGV